MNARSNMSCVEDSDQVRFGKFRCRSSRVFGGSRAPCETRPRDRDSKPTKPAFGVSNDCDPLGCGCNSYTRKHLPVSILRHSATFIAGAVCCTLALSAQTPVPVAVIKLQSYEPGTSLLTVHASVGGHDGTFLFDTGEGISAISSAIAQKTDCKPWGQVTGFRMTGERIDSPHCDNLTFEMAGQSFAAPTAAVFDIMKFFPPDNPQLDGSIGLDLFAGRKITFAYSARTITIESPESFAARIAHATEIPIRVVRDAEGAALTVDVGVPTPDGTAWMELDSGGGSAFIIANHIAPLLQLDTASKARQTVSLAIGKVPVTAPARTASHLIMDGNINVPFLEKWDVTLDLATGRAWVAPAVANY